MKHKAIHEIIYKDELGQNATIAPNTTLTDAHVKALGDNLSSLVKSKAIVVEKPRPAADGFEPGVEHAVADDAKDVTASGEAVDPKAPDLSGGSESLSASGSQASGRSSGPGFGRRS